ncbi:hypothetical protein Pelo_549 [Pelomyxa schiedti]|nr:hypothetical protein Pelo_549 [Pelomyxa schiedti]
MEFNDELMQGILFGLFCANAVAIFYLHSMDYDDTIPQPRHSIVPCNYGSLKRNITTLGDGDTNPYLLHVSGGKHCDTIPYVEKLEHNNGVLLEARDCTNFLPNTHHCDGRPVQTRRQSSNEINVRAHCLSQARSVLKELISINDFRFNQLPKVLLLAKKATASKTSGRIPQPLSSSIPPTQFQQQEQEDSGTPSTVPALSCASAASHMIPSGVAAEPEPAESAPLADKSGALLGILHEIRDELFELKNSLVWEKALCPAPVGVKPHSNKQPFPVCISTSSSASTIQKSPRRQ